MRRGLLAAHAFLAIVSAVCAGIVVSRTGGISLLGSNDETPKSQSPYVPAPIDVPLRQLLGIKGLSFTVEMPEDKPWARLFALTFEDGKLVEKKAMMTFRPTDQKDRSQSGEVVWGEVDGKYERVTHVQGFTTQSECDPRWKQHMAGFISRKLYPRPLEFDGFQILAFAGSSQKRNGKERAGVSSHFESTLEECKTVIAIAARLTEKEER